MLRVFAWAERSIAGAGAEGGHIYCTYTHTHAHRHIHTYTSQGLCEAIPRSCSSFSILFIRGGDPGAPLRTTDVQPPRTTRCHHLDHLSVVLQKPSRSRVNSQPGKHCNEPGNTPGRCMASACPLLSQQAPVPLTGTTWPSSKDKLPQSPHSGPASLPRLCPRLCFLRCQSFPESRDHRAAAPASHGAAAGTSSEPAAAAGKEMRLEHTPISSFIPLCL